MPVGPLGGGGGGKPNVYSVYVSGTSGKKLEIKQKKRKNEICNEK